MCQPNSEGFLSICADYSSSDGVTGEGTQLIITGGRLLSRQPVKVYFVTCLPEYIAIILLLLKQVEQEEKWSEPQKCSTGIWARCWGLGAGAPAIGC